MNHIRPIGDTTKYLSIGTFDENIPVPMGYEFVKGLPNPEAESITIISPYKQLKNIFSSLDPEEQLEILVPVSNALNALELGSLETAKLLLNQISDSINKTKLLAAINIQPLEFPN